MQPDIRIMPMRDAQAEYCRNLLPDAFPAIGRPADCLVAERGGAIVGVGAMGWVPNGFPVLFHIVPVARRQGIGRALFDAHRAAAQGETPGLRNWQSVLEDSDTAAFLLACGFEVAKRFEVYESDPSILGAAMSALLKRMRPRIPAGVKLVPPSEAPADDVAALLVSEFSLRPQLLNIALTGDAAQGWDQALSRVVLVDGAVAGAVLARRTGTTLEVDYNVVAPEWRGGWANLLLVEGVLRNGLAEGLTKLRFLAEPHVRDTINLARRAGGTRMPDQLVLGMML